jgi:hypothetical protein
MGWKCGTVRGVRGACRFLVGKRETKQGRNKEIGWDCVN